MTSRSRPLKDLFWILALFGLVAGVFRMVFGLGATTNLSDAVPWGLWKVLNMVAGVALSTSGFTVGFLVYVLRLEQFRPLVKPAVLIALLGYGSSCLALLFDIGLPHRFWHPFVMWNEHSFLFEVFWCVMLYFSVTIIEILPTVFERLRRDRWAHWLHGIAFGVVIVGISLSSLHHSSLGSLFLVSPQRLHGLWYSPLLPLFFILSAMGGGLMFLVLVRILHARCYEPEAVFGSRVAATGMVCAVAPDPTKQAACPADPSSTPLRPATRNHRPMLTRLASIATGILGLYLVLKIVDLLRSDGLRLLGAGTWESWLYIFELIVAAALPVLLLAIPRVRRSPLGLGTAAAAATLGLALNRLNVGIFGYWRDAQTIYVPSLAEWALGIGVVAAAGLAFLAAVENLPIFGPLPARSAHRSRPTFDAFTRVWSEVLTSSWHRATLLAVVVLPLGWVSMYPPFRHPQPAAIVPPTGLNATRSVLAIDGDRAGVRTEFAHADHQQRLGGEASCTVCHHVHLPHDSSTPCSRCHRTMLASTDVFDHSGHMQAVARRDELGGLQPENQSCASCHAPGVPKTAAGTVGCAACHQQDMGLSMESPAATLELAHASSHLDAMHGTCLKCHEDEEARGGRAGLAECGTCHPSLRRRELRIARH